MSIDSFQSCRAPLEALSGFFFPPDNGLHAQFTVVLGMTLWERPLQRALALYREGRAGRLILCGGYNPKIGGIEALEMQRAIRVAGIPERDLLIDPHSRNTAENFKNAALLIKECTSGHPPDSINIVSIHYHIRRALLTAREEFGSGVAVGAVTYPSIHYASEEWFASARGRNDVLRELRKIQDYFPDALLPEMTILSGRNEATSI
jgi:uncharacterized SAM-binding protein YcdF (DUF218 family)